MDIGFNEDQNEIRNQAHRFMENECPPTFVRAMYEDERGFTDDLWAKMAEMGWMGMRIPEEYDGIGLKLIDICVVLEEMGRAILPGPYFSTVLLAAEALLEAGGEDQKKAYLPRIALGELKGTLALLEPDSGPEPGYVQMPAAADGDGYVLSGVKLFVPDAHVADFMVVAARTQPGQDRESGLTLFLVDAKAPGLTIQPCLTMDGTRRQSEVRFDGVKVSKADVLGQVGGGWAVLAKVLERAAVGLAAENVGGAQKALEIAVEYAKVRHQFGQPIGGFQAIKHKCAEMLVLVEGSRSILYWAAWAVEDDPPQAALAASAAKAYSSDAYRTVASQGIQILGGIGITWEHDMHLYLKRAKANQVALGDSAYHQEEVARQLG